MANKPTVLVDINVLLDVLQKREPFFESSARLLSLIESGKVKGFVTSHSVTTLFYLIKKDRSTAEAKATITNILQLMKVAAVDQNAIEQALNLDYRDFEDAVQMIAAMQCKADCLITRNIRDYQPQLLAVLQPVDFLAAL
jgi:predicted nucleic acid-binding protein